MSVTASLNDFRISSTPTVASPLIIAAPRTLIKNSPRLHSVPFNSISRTQTQIAARGGRGFGAVEEEKSRLSKRKDDASGSGGGAQDDDTIPQAVFDRMLRRIVWFVGTPMATGVALLWAMGALKSAGVWDVPKWLPFASTLVLFGTSAIGIAYGTLSSSWDPNRDGSLLGWEEAQQNWPMLWKDDEEEAAGKR